MNIAIFYNPSKDEAKDLAKGICQFLSEKGVHIFAEDDQSDGLKARGLSTCDPKKIQFAICLGGDGSILRLIHRHPDIQAPILGINLGSLGFLADTPLSEVYPTLQDFLDGKYRIQERIVMDGVTSANDECFAVNELVIHRARNPSLIDLAIYVDGDYLNTFSADGVIVSTPTGSTAYSLAAGGPILTPELDVFVITPISAHTISNRPIVLMPKQEVRIEYMSKHDPVEISYDGFTNFMLSPQESISIKRSERKFRLVNMFDHDYFATLRTKLGWTGKLKNMRL